MNHFIECFVTFYCDLSESRVCCVLQNVTVEKTDTDNKGKENVSLVYLWYFGTEGIPMFCCSLQFSENNFEQLTLSQAKTQKNML